MWTLTVRGFKLPQIYTSGKELGGKTELMYLYFIHHFLRYLWSIAHKTEKNLRSEVAEAGQLN